MNGYPVVCAECGTSGCLAEPLGPGLTPMCDPCFHRCILRVVITKAIWLHPCARPRRHAPELPESMALALTEARLPN